jgi:hypothetical protein
MRAEELDDVLKAFMFVIPRVSVLLLLLPCSSTLGEADSNPRNTLDMSKQNTEGGLACLPPVLINLSGRQRRCGRSAAALSGSERWSGG